MTSHSCEMAALRVVLLAALFIALIVPSKSWSQVPTQEPIQFEAAFQGRCGEGSPCEQLCRELHDGTFECGCGAGFVLHVDGYGCMQLNSTKADATLSLEDDVIYQKDVTFTAELEIAPQAKLIAENTPQKHINTALPSHISNEIIQTKILDFKQAGERSKVNEGITNLIEDGLSRTEVDLIEDTDQNGVDSAGITTQGPSLEQKVPSATVPPPMTVAVEKCNCQCGDASCACPHTLKSCQKGASTISVPRFSGPSWLALRPLRGAYKRVRIRIRIRPERATGVILLTGENDDLSGDYLALVLKQGYVELRFDCGSGSGMVRSRAPVRLGRWNTISMLRRRWDAALRLNQGPRNTGRSKGLFSRMTFREPVWVGGSGNTTGLQAKLGLTEGLLGCVDYLRINGQKYNLLKDSLATYDIAECAPTLAPWTPTSEATTLPTKPPKPSQSNLLDHHALYNINDIVNFEDNDLVMRDATEPKHTEPNEKSNENFNIVDYIKKQNGNQEILSNSNAIINKEMDSDNILLKSKPIDMMQTDETCACQHGGGCVGGVCLCPLGYAGVRCDITLDLKVPRFNGSSYLRLPGLGNSAESWLNIQITLKASNGDGLVLYDSDHVSGEGDYFSLHLRNFYIEFAFDLGSGSAVVRSAHPLERDRWHRVTVNRAGKKATLTVYTDDNIPTLGIHSSESRAVQSLGPSKRLALRRSLYLGGAPRLPARLALTTSLSGCVRRLIINDAEIAVVAAALSGVNVDNCDTIQQECTDKNLCTEKVYPIPTQENQTETYIHHSIVPKKGIQTKHKKPKTKKYQPAKDWHQKPVHTRFSEYDGTQKPVHTGFSGYEGTQKPVHNRFSDYEGTQKPVHTRFSEYPGTQKPVHTRFSEYEGTQKPDLSGVIEESGIDQQSYYEDIDWSDFNSYPSFSGNDSYIHIDDEETIKRLQSPTLEINVRFRTSVGSGLLVWSGGSGDYLAIALANSHLVFSYNLGSGEVVIVAYHTRVDDGQWHRAKATRNGQAGVLEVDGLGSVGKILPGTLTQLNTKNGLYIGGLPSIHASSRGRFKSGIVGCVSQVTLGGDFGIPLALSRLPYTITSNVGRCDG